MRAQQPKNVDISITIRVCNLIPSLYIKIKEIINDYYKFEIKIDNNGFPYFSQTTVICPKIQGKPIIKNLIEFDQKQFKNTKNYKKIIEKYGKVYLYNNNNMKKEFKHSRKNEIYNDESKILNNEGNDNEINNNKKTVKESNKINDIKNIGKNGPIIDINFPSIEVFIHYKICEHYIKKNCKYKTINNKCLFINISLEDNQRKIIKKFLGNEDKIKSIFNDKIISYGYPLLKIGIINGIYYNKIYYTFNEEKKYLIKNTIKRDYKEIIEKDYQYIGIYINDIFCLIDVLPINYSDNGFWVPDYHYKYLIPLEITSLLYKLEIEEKKIIKKCLKNDNKNNKYLQFLEEKKENIKNIEIDKNLLEKEKEEFLFDEDSRNKKVKEQKNSPKKQTKTRKEKGKGKCNKYNVIGDTEIDLYYKYKNIDEFY